MLLAVIDVAVRNHGRAPVPDLVLVCLSSHRLPPLVGNDLGHTDLIGRPPMHVRDSSSSRSLSMTFTLLLSRTGPLDNRLEHVGVLYGFSIFSWRCESMVDALH